MTEQAKIRRERELWELQGANEPREGADRYPAPTIRSWTLGGALSATWGVLFLAALVVSSLSHISADSWHGASDEFLGWSAWPIGVFLALLDGMNAEVHVFPLTGWSIFWLALFAWLIGSRITRWGRQVLAQLTRIADQGGPGR